MEISGRICDWHSLTLFVSLEAFAEMGFRVRKIILMGRSEAGKTTLRQALNGNQIHYHKTQYINHGDVVIDTPGEYAENKELGSALALYSYEADVIGLLVNAQEPYCLFPPCITAQATRPVIGIVTQIHHPDAYVERAASWLRLAGCTRIFPVDSVTGEGVQAILDYLEGTD